MRGSSRYEIVDTIAAGSLAVVYRARHAGLDRAAALKRLDLRSDDRTAVARFMRESRPAAGLEHPNIVTVFDFFEREGVANIAMEYLPFGSLRPWIGRLRQVQAIAILDGILAGLGHAQQLNLAHRDLRPENVLLTGGGGVKIADFGIAKAYANATGLEVGRPAYMAPEQVTAGLVGARTDLYALGAMAFELFSGRPPFASERHATALLYRRVHEPAPPLTQLDPRLAAWVARLLEQDPERRPAGAREAREALAELAGELHGPLWRRDAMIGAAPWRLDALPHDLSVPVRGALERAAPAGDLTLDARTHEPFLIHDPDATFEVSGTPHGASLRHLTRWRRRHANPRRRRLHRAPPPFADHVDRAGEIRSLGDSIARAQAVNVYGNRGIGKTHVLVEALQGAETVFLDGRGRSADDLLHALYDELHVTRVAVRDPRIARELKACSATVAIEDADLDGAALARLLAAAPRCRFVLTTRERVLWDGPAIKVGGLAPRFAPALAAQELGHDLAADDHDAAIALALSLFGHPLWLRQAFRRAREAGASLASLREELAAPPLLQDRLASLSPLETRVVRALAVYDGAPIAGAHLRALLPEAELDVALERLVRRHDVAVADGRYRLLGVLAHALPLADELAEETVRASAHFAARPVGEEPAILALIERAFRDGRCAEAIQLARAVEGRLAPCQRWAAWGRMLAIVLACSYDLGEDAIAGWAWHQLGVRSLGLGRPAEARSLLERALDVRETAGDARGADVTRANLRALRRVRSRPATRALSTAP